MKGFRTRYQVVLPLVATVLIGTAGLTQAAALKCGSGVLFFRAYDTDDGDGSIKREVHFTIFRFTNPRSSATATISQIKFFNPAGAVVETLGDGGDPFVDVGFDPVIGPRAQVDLNLRDVFATPDPPDRLRVRLVAISNRSLKGAKIRVARGFKPFLGQQEERSRLILSCKD